MVNRYKVPKVNCYMQFPFGRADENSIIMIDELVYGKRVFQINGVLLNVM